MNKSTTNLLDEMLSQVKLSKKTTAKEQKILENATFLFASKGYANTSTSEIAKASGVAEATIFRHYGTKENLLIAIVIPFLKEAIPALADDLFQTIDPENQPSFADFLRALIHNRLEFVQQNKEIFMVFIKEIVYREEIREQFIPFFLEQAAPRMYMVMDSFKARGQLKDLPNALLLRTIFTNILGYFLTQHIFHPHPDVDHTKQEVDILVGTIMHGIASS
ncbi:TetR/AcrR family transcriptional regulator [Paenibacillus sp. Marseille-Q4541]|uniref:TetR/AcrR family transcriptional regulator n=1 Tax=Paenibacillus sp. Marseille-Q4541 TaxID=2831522 RepID=UPI001BAB5A13|nr:TetR/AcrR family transcriptional regulator [Paenibacillus sp. Marseille-Q4541]